MSKASGIGERKIIDLLIKNFTQMPEMAIPFPGTEALHTTPAKAASARFTSSTAVILSGKSGRAILAVDPSKAPSQKRCSPRMPAGPKSR